MNRYRGHNKFMSKQIIEKLFGLIHRLLKAYKQIQYNNNYI